MLVKCSVVIGYMIKAQTGRRFVKIYMSLFPTGRERGDALCQLVSESPVAAVVRHHELLQLVQVFSPLVRVQQLQQQH